MNPEEVLEYITDKMPPEVAEHLSRGSSSWQYNPGTGGRKGPDGDPLSDSADKDDTSETRKVVQQRCWNKAARSPFASTALRALAGRMAGKGFAVTSSVPEIASIILKTERDYRNRLYSHYLKYAYRSVVEGELFLTGTFHNDGFVEVDFIDPASICGGDDDHGIIFHSKKANLPLVYLVDDGAFKVQIPSIYIARNPDMLLDAGMNQYFDSSQLIGRSSKFSAVGGFRTFVIAFDKGFLTKRNIGYLRTVIDWIELYENIKRWEADYKKAASAYVWEYKMTDPRAWNRWLAMTDQQRKETGITAAKTPGATFITPPGFDLNVKNPMLSKITDEDVDIRNMISAGLNEPSDVTFSESRSTFASVNASRGPFTERIEDEVEQWTNFWVFDFWANVFFVLSKVAGFPESFKTKECIGFDDNKKPKIEEVERSPEEMIRVEVPIGEVSDIEAKARAYLGVKHGPVSDTLGISKGFVAEKLGIRNYRRERQRYEAEKEEFPELPLMIDSESAQEKKEAEPGKKPDDTPPGKTPPGKKVQDARPKK